MLVCPERYTGKKVAVTGAGGGIGRAVAQRIAAENGGLFLIDRDSETLNEVAENIINAGGVVLESAPLDIVDSGKVAQSIQEFESTHGSIDCLVHCVGVVGESNVRADEAELDVFREVVETNLTGSFIMCKSVLPGMVAKGYGRILLLASIAGKRICPRRYNGERSSASCNRNPDEPGNRSSNA